MNNIGREMKPSDAEDDPKPDSRTHKKLKITANNGRFTLTKSKDQPAPRVSRSTKAKLAKLPSMPLDILFEIFGHLLPLDILHLARTTKAFRSVLMRRSAISIWKSARSNVPDLPECLDMSEPAFANLAFDMHCHNCLTINVSNVCFLLRVRYCMKCSKTCLIPRHSFSKNTAVNKMILACAPFSACWAKNGGGHCTIEAKENLVKEFSKLSEESRSAFITQKVRELNTLSLHPRKLVAWLDSTIQARAEELDTIREDRKSAIIEKLTEAGWGDEIRMLPQFHDRDTYGLVLLHEHDLVRQPRPLTDRVWSNIKGEMLNYMEHMKAWRLGEERLDLLEDRREIAVSIWRTYRRSNPSADITPSVPEFLEREDVKAIIKLPSNITVNLASFSEVEKPIPIWIDEWRQSKILELLLKADVDDLPWPTTREAKEASLKLASYVFTCSKNLCFESEEEVAFSYHPMFYPEYLHHRCNRIRRIDWSTQSQLEKKRKGEDPDTPSLKLGAGYPYCAQRQAWSCEELSFDHKASKVVRKIIEACGWNWKMMKAEEMDKRDPRIVCLKCTYGHKCDGERRVTVMTWKKAVEHCVEKHWGDCSKGWQKISEEDAAIARFTEWSRLKKHPKNIASWRCVHCQDRPFEPERMVLERLELHLERRHNINRKEMEEGVHYVRALDAPPWQPPCIAMIPNAV